MDTSGAFRVVLKRALISCPRLPRSLDQALIRALETSPPGSDEVEAVRVHHLGPRRYEVFHKLLLRVRAPIDFRQSTQLRVRTEDQVDAGAGPLNFVCLPVMPLVYAFRVGGG